MPGSIVEPLPAIASKSEIRKQVLARRDALSEAGRARLSASIITRVLALDAYREAHCVMAYIGFGSEIDTAAFVMDALSTGKTLVLPRVERGCRSLGLHRVRDVERELESGVWGIRQPRANCPAAEASSVEFVLVPGVAFTPRAERLGYGGGFYDRLIRDLAARPALVAAAFDLQMVQTLPISDTDQRVDCVLTESAAYPSR